MDAVKFLEEASRMCKQEEKYSFDAIVAAKRINEGRLDAIPPEDIEKCIELYKKIANNI